MTQAIGIEAPRPEESAAPRAGMGLRRYTAVTGWGLLVTTLGQMRGIGELPIRFLLKYQLHTTPSSMAQFLFWATLPWSFKPVAGLVVDGVALFGSHRRNYLALSAALAGLGWVAFGLVPRFFQPMMWTAFAFNVMAVFASVTVGGLLVQGGHAHGATGRLSTLRLVVINSTAILSGLVAGFLAAHWFGWTVLAGSGLFFSLVPVAAVLIVEPPSGRHARPPHPAAGLVRQFRQLLHSRNLWICGSFFFLVQVCPGLGTPLLYYQTDVLKFSPEFIGFLGTVAGVFGLAGSFVYPLVCKRFRLRWLLVLAIVCCTLGSLAYLGYVSRGTAIAVEGVAALAGTIAQLPLFDLAARATPRGSESVGYSLMIALWNLGAGLSDVTGSYLFDHYRLTFKDLVWVNGGTTAAILLVIPLLPGSLLDRKEGTSGQPL